ncbi:MAG: PEP-utilizing enzyme [Patescibacteria group bacterium]|nr:PEP-utilizing enzyme [Patescibacteria group bacterium]
MSQPVVTSHQISMTEWLAAIGQTEESNAFREEDNRKAKRLEFLFRAMGVPYERPESLPARELSDLGPRFKEILETRGDELCAIRLVPNKPELPKLRQRGLSIRDCYENWFLKQEISADDYEAFLCPHSETLLWSATFVVSDRGVYGEIVRGLHSQLTHGYTENQLFQFAWDFDKWRWSPGYDEEAASQVLRMLALLKTDDEAARSSVTTEMNAEFSHGYLKGYFESTVWPDNKVYIIDYNRLLPKYLPDFIELTGSSEAAEEARGAVASNGRACGRVRIMLDPEAAEFSAGDILVCDMTDVRYLPYMRIAGAIITDRGSILSHAAIVSRELNKPCIIGTKIATKVLHDGDEVEVDANRGTVRILS